ncbi:MAG TPA: hypothetical protein GX710_08915 [Clostridiales bacterium]|nr:hypothetical protein [Clostridiales bacterium]
MNYEEERRRINCTDQIHQINPKYEDGIINLELFLAAKYRILWILKETNGDFSLDYFRNATKLKRGTWKTWKNVGIASSLILENDQSTKLDPTTYLKQIAIINLKKTPGKSSTKMGKFTDDYQSTDNEDTRIIVQKQIKNINPNIIICGNVLSLLSNQLKFREALKVEPMLFPKKNNMYCFNNVVFINAYHPCYPTLHSITLTSKKYCEIISNSVTKWIELKNLGQLSEYDFERL